MGNRVIHIYDREELVGKPRTAGPLSHSICRQKLSETEIFQLFIKPPSFKNRIEFHLRPCEEPVEVDAPHEKCHSRLLPRETLDLRLLATSCQIRRDATRVIYTTNIFSFNALNILKRWLQMVPPHLLTYVQHLNIEVPMQGGCPKFETGSWRVLYSGDLNAKLPHLKSLSVGVFLNGLVTCWRNNPTSRRAFMNTFRPLRQLKCLQSFTMVINEYVKHDGAMHERCADQTHDENPRYSYWVRKELRRVWAEEVREMVLGGREA